ncbi:uncharacterized protein KY384_001001 [Bacidia gigantensis]|uniref:uncharacterized protein n=1 Tax=Bacidia gigantensis TaxID=2732470 RepID=UPI001D03B99D|nr:uncharacterized protein KY384_001001 [Bacidia gigantensis]KAG8534157.1 hypothetical protein KY384_001001 [Bacidia gigantensis]
MGTIVAGSILVAKGGHGLYLGLIIIWAGPFILLLWNLAYQFVIGLPISNTFIPIAIPTIYLWAVDTLALRRGTWTIESGTKLGLCLWEGLEIEEAIFFLLTNVLIILGLVAFDNAFAVLQTFPHIFPSLPSIPSPFLLVEALITSTQAYDERRIEALQQALARLKAKSRSFYLASSVFQGRLRVDLILLYSFCRVADDLIDEARSVEEAREWISKLRSYLDSRYDNGTRRKSNPLHDPIGIAFPAEAQAALRYLPTEYLSPAPLYDLLRGFETDLNFASSSAPFPIRDEDSLNEYGAQVAGTVAESCLELVYHHTQLQTQSSQKSRILEAGRQMGVALQYVNIARDIAVDAVNKRVYLPTSWLKEEDLLPESILSDPYQPTVERVRQRLLDRAMAIYEPAKSAIEELPAEARAPMRVAVESYVEIGRVLRTPNYRVKAGRATVPKLRRLRVAWKALGQ